MNSHATGIRAVPRPPATNGRLPARLLAAALLLSAFGCPPLAAQDITGGLKAYWPMDAATGGTVADQSGNGNTGTLTGNAAISTQGKVGGCLEMAARQDGYVPFPTLAWQPTAFSVAFWINPASHSDWGNQIGSSIGWGGFIFHTDPGGGIHTGTDVGSRIAMGAGTAALNEWQHFTFTYDGTAGRLYKNGALLDTKPMAAPLAWGGFYVGNPGAGGTLHGRIDEVRIYDRAVTAREVELLMAYPHIPIACTWNGSAGTGWDNAANWTPAAVPTAHDDVTVNYCTVCPQLAGPVSVRSLTLNTASGLSIGNNVLEATAGLSLYGATISGGGGTLRSADITQVGHCTFNGTAVTLERIATQNTYSRWHGGNTYNCTATITCRRAPGLEGVCGMIQVQTYERDVFNGPLTVNSDNAYGISFHSGGISQPTLCNAKTVFNNIGSGLMTIGVNNNSGITFGDDVEVNNGGTDLEFGGGAGDGVIECRGSATFNNVSPPSIGAYGNTIYIGGDRNRSIVFHRDVTVSNTTASPSNWDWSPCDVRIGYLRGEAWTGSITFLPAARLKIGSAGFRRGNLYVDRCEFRTTAATTLDMAGNPGYTGRLVLTGGTAFAGSLTATAPRLQVGGATFNGEASFTKAGEGADNWPGGNVFKRKLTITNRAGAASPVNMATMADDVVRQ